MNKKVLKTLEYNKIIKMLESKAISQDGKELCSTLEPSSDMYEIIRWLDETSEAESIILKKGSLPLGGIKNISDAVNRCRLGGILSIDDLMAVSDFLYVCKKICKYKSPQNSNDQINYLTDYFSGVSYIESLTVEINRCIVNENEISDSASPQLYKIRQSIKTCSAKIKEQLNSILHSQTYKSMLQDFVITIRNDRYCLPVKQEYRSTFKGMVHDQSATGSTLFIEPLSVIETNNKIKELSIDEKTEIENILRNLSALVSEHVESLSNSLESITKLDFVFAKAELSLSMSSTRPIINNKKYINIKKGRHPLLDKTKIVPINVNIGKDFTSLLITGPNTGGKTVTIKTMGLFCLMGQSGLHIPAEDNSEIPVFDEIFADIGDEQSIEQSLSTFSAHMSNIIKILENVTSNCLILLDELCAGTDPTEGAALAIAILQFINSRNALTVVTTHYSELKVYALTTDGVMNASCEFDVQTLNPTYKLLIGVPGKSNAFAISRKLGLNDNIIDTANGVLSSEDRKFEDIITELEISRKSVLDEQSKATENRRKAQAFKANYEQANEKLQIKQEKILNDARAEAFKITQEAKDEADKILKEIRNLQNASVSNALSQAEEKRVALSKRLKEHSEASGNTKNKNSWSVPKTLNIGDKVFIHSLGQNGYVSSSPSSSGELMVHAGIMNIKVHLADVSIDHSEEIMKTDTRNVSHSIKSGKSISISPELDIRGFMIDEGIEALDKYLDDAYLSGLSQVSIIHGKGTGALRNAVQAHLRNHHFVKSYRFGAYGEGDTGVTIVELNK